MREATELHRAATRQDLSMVYVRAYRAGQSLDLRDATGATPLHRALEVRGCVSPVNAYLLLALGAAPDLADDRGVRPLHLACAIACLPAAQILLRLGADPDATDAEGKTPERYLALNRGLTDEWRKAPIVELLRGPGAAPGRPGLSLVEAVRDYATLPEAVLLIREGADPNARDAAGRSPLHTAASTAIRAALLAKGADPNAQSADGRTPLHLAVEGFGYEVDLLLEGGADPSIADAKGVTPIDLLEAMSFADDFYDGDRLESRRASLIAAMRRAASSK